MVGSETFATYFTDNCTPLCLWIINLIHSLDNSSAPEIFSTDIRQSDKIQSWICLKDLWTDIVEGFLERVHQHKSQILHTESWPTVSWQLSISGILYPYGFTAVFPFCISNDLKASTLSLPEWKESLRHCKWRLDNIKEQTLMLSSRNCQNLGRVLTWETRWNNG